MENVDLDPNIWKAAALLLGMGFLALAGAGLRMLIGWIKSLGKKIDTYIEKLTESIQKLMTNDAVQDEKLKQHAERLENLEEGNIFPVKYRK